MCFSISRCCVNQKIQKYNVILNTNDTRIKKIQYEGNHVQT